MSSYLTIRGVEKRYGRRVALQCDGFEVRKGERIAVVGGNGSGKSTLLRLVAGTLSAIDRGEVTRSPDWPQLRIGYLPQAGGIYNDLTIEQNLRVFRQLFGSRGENDRIREMQQRLGISAHLQNKVSNLSGGWQRLAALFVLLSSGADALVLDEPLTSVDVDRRLTAAGAIRRAASNCKFLVAAVHPEDIEATMITELDQDKTPMWTKVFCVSSA